MKTRQTFAAFADGQLVGRGTIESVVRTLHPVESGEQAGLRIFEEATGRAVDLDWRGDVDEVSERARKQFTSRPLGRPKLGVESREVTLLPRHWRWLESHGRSASATLRRLVDQQMRGDGNDRPDVDPLYRLMSALAGDLPRFEEASRHLYALEWGKLREIVSTWPGEIGEYLDDRLDDIAAG